MSEPDGTRPLDPNRTQALPGAKKQPPRFPVEGWDRFEPLAFLGEGGMGRVFKARDVRLNRLVALKFIRGDDPELLERFRQEARSQALIDHPHVCKVYEVGEEGGHVYLSMQYIDGEPLSRAARHMDLETKTTVIQTCAEAVHEAHRMGIIHRDLKPANIMVEKNDQGHWWPFIMDFGLARNTEAPGLTQSGVAMGTPAYMPPEQALGRHEDIDRRSDVYALGATLYDLLAGEPPFTAPAVTDLLWKVVREEAPSLARAMPDVPADLATIVAKCLEKEPQRRYDSARALAEDLRRYLEGEPIVARPASLMYRLRKKIRKHRALSLSILLSAAVGLGFAGWGLRAVLRSRSQAQLAGRFAMEVKAIEEVMRIAHMSPLHDLRPEQARVRTRMARIRRDMESLGSVAEGPGWHALGLGHAALGEQAEAVAAYRKAWDADYRPPVLALALGRALAARYGEEQRRAAQLPLEEQEAKLKAARVELLDPARTLIREHLASTEEGRPYLEALLAHLEGQEEPAAEKAQAALAESPGLYEAKSLEAEARLAQARNHRLAGELPHALAALQASEKALSHALELGRSDPALWRLEGDRRAFQAEVMSLTAPWPQASAAFRRALDACAEALRADPGDAEALRQQGQTWHDLATQELDRGLDNLPALGRSREALQRFLELRPQEGEGWFLLGKVAHATARAKDTRGETALEAYDQALAAYGEAQARGRESSERAALTQLFKAQHLEALGRDPSETLAQAETRARQARAAREDRFSLNTLGLVLNDRAKALMARGQDPLPLLREAGACFQTGYDRYHAPASLRNLADRWLLQAQWEASQNRDPRKALDTGLQTAQEAIRQGPGYFLSHLTLGRLLALRGKHGGGTADFIEARKALLKAQSLNPKDLQVAKELQGLIRG